MNIRNRSNVQLQPDCEINKEVVTESTMLSKCKPETPTNQTEQLEEQKVLTWKMCLINGARLCRAWDLMSACTFHYNSLFAPKHKQAWKTKKPLHVFRLIMFYCLFLYFLSFIYSAVSFYSLLLQLSIKFTLIRFTSAQVFSLHEQV